MAEEKFKIYKAHKMLDWLENQTTEWAIELIQDHFDIENVEDLTREQLDEVIEQYEDMVDYDSMLGMGLRNAIGIWENENEEYVL